MFDEVVALSCPKTILSAPSFNGHSSFPLSMLLSSLLELLQVTRLFTHGAEDPIWLVDQGQWRVEFSDWKAKNVPSAR